ncbi:MAG: dephospho-CoA kinase [Hyphomicrobiales bacterium]|nr:dephospho-CoA kinase [Hyphomicrobiales bacterium]
MIILGLTGSIGMGKSTTADMFRAENIPVHDADKSVHQLYENEAVLPLKILFPTAVVDGRVDRQELGRIVLNDPGKMNRLENLIHPMVREKERKFLQKARLDNAPIVVLDIPLLFETGGENRVDAVVVVTASFEQQKNRVLARKDMNEEKFMSILKKQLPDHEKRQKADFIVDTELGMESARSQVQEIIQQLLSLNNKK